MTAEQVDYFADAAAAAIVADRQVPLRSDRDERGRIYAAVAGELRPLIFQVAEMAEQRAAPARRRGRVPARPARARAAPDEPRLGAPARRPRDLPDGPDVGARDRRRDHGRGARRPAPGLPARRPRRRHQRIRPDVHPADRARGGGSRCSPSRPAAPRPMRPRPWPSSSSCPDGSASWGSATC
jgi:hypothetical protein